MTKMTIGAGRLDIEADGVQAFVAACDAAHRHFGHHKELASWQKFADDLSEDNRKLRVEKYILARELRRVRKLATAK